MNRRLRNPDLLPVAIAGAVGLLLAAIDVGGRSLWLDEASTFAIVSQHGAALWHGIAHDGGNMFLYYVVMHVVLAWFGDATWLMRLPSVLANGLTGALVAAAALRLFPAQRRLATAAGLLAVVSLPLVYWGQNVRGYAWLVTLSVASFLALIAILQTPAERSPSRAVVAYVLSTLAALYIGYDVALLIPAQLVLLLIRRERARLVIACLALVALLSVPLLVLAAERGSGQLFWVTPLDWQTAGQAVLALFSAAFLPNFHRTATTAPAVIATGLAVLAGLGVAARIVLATRRLDAKGGRSARWVPGAPAAPDSPPGAPGVPGAPAGQAWPLLLILAWVLVPTVLTVVAYASGEPIELTRVTILELPALALLVAWLLLRPEMKPALGVAAVAVVLALRLLQVIPSYGVSPEPWSTVTAYVLRATPARGVTCVAFYAQDGREAFDYYLLHTTRRRTVPWPNLRPVLPTPPWATVRPYVERYGSLDAGQRARVARQCPRLWLITSHSGQAGGTRRSLVNLQRYQALEGSMERLYPHHSLRTFGWASTIRVLLLSRDQGRSHMPT